MDRFKLALFLYMIEIRESNIEFYKPYLKLYKIDEEKYMNYAVEEGYIKVTKAAEGIELATVKMLKDVLRTKGLLQTGNKEQLINRLKEFLTPEELAKYFENIQYRLTSEGRKYLLEHSFVIDYHKNFKATDKFTLKMIGEKALAEGLTYHEAVQALERKKIDDEKTAEVELKDGFGKKYIIVGIAIMIIVVAINMWL